MWDTKGGVQLAMGADRVDIGEGGMYVRYASEVDTRRRAWREVRRLADGDLHFVSVALHVALHVEVHQPVELLTEPFADSVNFSPDLRQIDEDGPVWMEPYKQGSLVRVQ